MEMVEVLAYLGSVLSALIARNISRIKNKSFINKMFFFYFATDFFMGIVETFYLFKLKKER